jgi:RHH-type rel operon transcriptional repressor/antitoxin RelB
MLAVRLPEELERRLDQLSKETHRSKSYYVKCALEGFLQDQADYLLALARYEKVQHGERTYSLEEIEAHLERENDKH